jgi:phage shock protein A
MWPFRSKKEPEDTTERFERIEKAMRRLEEEWSDVYHKFRVLQMRVAKQVQRLDASSSQEEPQGAESDRRQTSSDGVPGASSLSPRLQRIQDQILERRRRAPVAKEGGE